MICIQKAIAFSHYHCKPGLTKPKVAINKDCIGRLVRCSDINIYHYNDVGLVVEVLSYDYYEHLWQARILFESDYAWYFLSSLEFADV